MGKRFGFDGRQCAPATAPAPALWHKFPDGGDAGFNSAVLSNQVRFPALQFSRAHCFDSCSRRAVIRNNSSVGAKRKRRLLQTDYPTWSLAAKRYDKRTGRFTIRSCDRSFERKFEVGTKTERARIGAVVLIPQYL